MKPKLVYFLSNVSIMMSALFIPNYALALGGSMVEIGLVGSAYGFSIFFSSYYFSRISDAKGRKGFILVGLLCSAVFFFLQAMVETPLLLLVVRGLVGFSLGIFTGPLIAYVHESGGKMGNLSSYGSMGWAVGGLLAGCIAQIGESFFPLNPLMPFRVVFLLSGLFYLTSIAFIRNLPEMDFEPRSSPLFPVRLFMKNFPIYTSLFLRNLGAFSMWIIFPLYLVDLGASKLWIGILYFINTGTQAVLMRRLDPFDEIKLVKWGLLLSCAVFFSFSLAPNFLWVIPLQVCLAFSYSFVIVGGLGHLTKRNEEKAASVGLMNSLTGICLGLGPILGGAVSESFGFKGVIYFGTLLAISGLLVMVFKSK